MADTLGPVADLKVDFLLSEMVVTYRSYSEFMKKNNLPGEVVVRFSRRQVRDQILKATSGTTLKIDGNEIRVLKVIPFEIRKKRNKYWGISHYPVSPVFKPAIIRFEVNQYRATISHRACPYQK